MSRDEMLKTVQSIKEPLVHLTAFGDGVVCDYITPKGCGGFELFDWGDLRSYDYDFPDETWEGLDDTVIQDWVTRLESGEFETIDIASKVCCIS